MRSKIYKNVAFEFRNKSPIPCEKIIFFVFIFQKWQHLLESNKIRNEQILEVKYVKMSEMNFITNYHCNQKRIHHKVIKSIVIQNNYEKDFTQYFLQNFPFASCTHPVIYKLYEFT